MAGEGPEIEEGQNPRPRTGGAGSAKRSESFSVHEVSRVVLIAAIVWSLRWATLGLHPPAGDGGMYFAMANGAEVPAPWSFHILTPRLAGSIAPGRPAIGFFAIAGFSFLLTSTAVVVMLAAKSFGMDARERLLGAMLFMTVYPGVAMFRSYELTDSLSYALLAVAVAAAVHHYDSILALATLIGVFNRETAFFVGPVWLALNIGRFSLGRLIFRSVLIFAPSAVGYILLHYTALFFGHLPAHFNYLSIAGITELWALNRPFLGTKSVVYGLAICVVLAFGPVWFIAGYGYFRSITRRDEVLKPLLALGTLAIPMAAALIVVDWRRGFQPIFPAVVTAGVIGLRAFSASHLRMSWYVAAGGTVLAANFVTEAWWSRKIAVPFTISMSLWICLMALVLVCNWARKPVQVRTTGTERFRPRSSTGYSRKSSGAGEE